MVELAACDAGTVKPIAASDAAAKRASGFLIDFLSIGFLRWLLRGKT